MNFEFDFLKCGFRLCFQMGRMIDAFTSSWLLLPAFLVTLSVHAATYYVATNGSDSWNGLAPAWDGTNGPWATFQNVPANAVAGTTFYLEGGIYSHTNDSTATMLNFYGALGTSTAPIVVTNYPGQTPIIYGSGPNNYGLQLKYSSWIKIFGLVISNAYRCTDISASTNCEVANCVFTGGNTNYGYLCPFTMDTGSQSNWIHNNQVDDALAPPVGDSTHCFLFGQFYAVDLTSYNIIESNVCFHAGHDVLGIYGPNNYVHGNFIHNENWYYRLDLQTNAAHRCVEIGGVVGYGNVFDGNRAQDAGFCYSTPHGIEIDGPANNIVRRNVFYGNSYSGITIYGGKIGGNIYWGSNYVYNNTIAVNGFGPDSSIIYTTNSSGTWKPPVPYQTNTFYPEWEPAITIANSGTNFLVNNLFSGNKYDGTYGAGESFDCAVADYRGNLTNSMAVAKYADTNNGGAWSQTQPNFALTSASPAIDNGAFLTTITSSSGSGTSFNVANAGWFFAGLTAAGHTVPGDSIQLQGQTSTATITAISGNTIIVSSSLTWTNGQGVALPYSGNAPDVGAFEYPTPVTGQLSPPSGLKVVTAK